MMSWKQVNILLAACLAVLLVACQKQETGKPAGTTSTVAADGLELTVHLTDQEISTSEMLEVEVVVRAEESIKVQMPAFAEPMGQWGDFTIFESHADPPVLDADGWVRQRRVFLLEPDLPGDSVLSAVTVQAVDGQGQSRVVRSQEHRVKMLSVLTQADQPLRDIAPIDRPEEKQQGSWWWAVGIGSVILLVIGWWLLRDRTLTDEVSPCGREFEKLQTAESGEVLQRLEKSFCRTLSDRLGEPLEKHDFSGLQQVVDVDAELGDAIADYDRMRYAARPADAAAVGQLYQRFARILDRTGKEVGS